MNKPKILFIDDDELLSLFVKEFLKDYEVFFALNAEDATQQLAKNTFDLIVLDLGLPDEDGLVLLRKWQYSRNTPIVIISSRSDEETRIAVLELGAADYLSKPFSPREFQLRIRRLLPIIPSDSHLNERSLIVFSFDPYLALDLNRREMCTKNAESFLLTRAEFDILAALVKQRGGVIKRNKLLDAISYQGKDVNPNSLGVLIHRIRKKLSESTGNESLISTIPNVGYRLNLPEPR